MKGPTERQFEVLRFIQSYFQERGYPPSRRDICKRFGIASLVGVKCHLDALERKGLIHRELYTPRTLVLTPAGRILLAAAGCIRAVEHPLLEIVGAAAAHWGDR